MNTISSFAVPFMIVFTIVWAFSQKADVYSAFTEGATLGLKSVVSIIPTILGLFVAIGVFRASGAMELIAKLLTPVTNLLGIPPSLVTFALLRPVSGSGSLAMASDIFANEGADSFVANTVSVMMGSTETTFYTLAVYFGAVGIKNTSYALRCALFADLICFVISICLCRIIPGLDSHL